MNDIQGSDWEQIFATSIGAEWVQSNLGLDDVQLQNTCWGAKTVKSTKPVKQKTVRLISGRNSVAYSFGDSKVKDVDADELGSKVLSIWNARVDSVRARFAHARTVVLLKGPLLNEFVVFEAELLRFEPELIKWDWNKQGNLQGFDPAGNHRFTWQPHGSQFTIIEHVPEQKAILRIAPPDEVQRLNLNEFLDSIGFKESWIKIE